MKTISLFLLVILVILITAYCTRAQSMSSQVVNVSGDSNKKGRFFFDWSLGEMALISKMQNTDSSVIMTNGVLQPFNIGRQSSNNFNLLGGDEVSLVPNPTTDNVRVTLRPTQKGRIKISLYNWQGNLLYYKDLAATGATIMEIIYMSGFIEGVYSLRIEFYPEGADPRKTTYKIVKVSK